MKITLITVGKIKERYFRDAILEYTKRLSKYCKLDMIEVENAKTPKGAGEKLESIIRDKEGERILQQIQENSYIIALAIKGEKLSSEKMADMIHQAGLRSVSHITFIIGGSTGLSEEIIRRANYLLSFSDMTFPHQMMKVILLEQIYRCYRIINGEPYHK